MQQLSENLKNRRSSPPMDDYETEQNKQAAIRALSNYSEFAMVCIGEGVTPHQLRLHLMKEISGMPTSLEDYKVPVARKGEGASSSSQATSSVEVKPSKQPTVLEQLEKMRKLPHKQLAGQK